MEIYSKGEYPADALSNFAPQPFQIDGIPCAGMEGFLQSLKYRSKKRQRAVCALTGKAAKRAGKYKLLWRLTGAVHWQGRRIKRQSAAFDALIARAYDALFENRDFRAALAASGKEPLTHSIGKSDPRRTILTEAEFIGNLLRLRENITTEEL